jgi:hypothetical protein
MNATIDLADGQTHVKVVAVALVMGILVVWIALSALI